MLQCSDAVLGLLAAHEKHICAWSPESHASLQDYGDHVHNDFLKAPTTALHQLLHALQYQTLLRHFQHGRTSSMAACLLHGQHYRTGQPSHRALNPELTNPLKAVHKGMSPPFICPAWPHH